MAVKSSYLIAGGVALLAVAWVASGQFAASRPEAEPPPGATPSDPLPRVRVQTLTASERAGWIAVQGRTEASRRVGLRSETTGRVVAIEAAEGGFVEAGAPILRLAMEDRSERLAEAEALLAQRQIEYEAARRLSEREFASRTRLAETRAELTAAQAQLAAIRTDIARTTIAAPFAGWLQERTAEIGDYVAVGAGLGTLLDLTPINVVADVSERDLAAVQPGAAATARLVTGASVAGRIAYVSASARPETRTFTVKVEVENLDQRVPAGITAEIRLPTRPVTAHLVSPSVLTLDDQGRIGVKTVDAQSTVRFHAVTILGEDAGGMWLAGLPQTVTLITLGQELVRDGQRVQAVPEPTGPA